MLGYTAEQNKKFKQHAWMALWAFAVLYCFLYCGKQNLSFAIPVMMKETGWTAMELGVLTSVQFWTYAVGQLVTGRLGEMIGLNKTIIAGMILSAAMVAPFLLRSDAPAECARIFEAEIRDSVWISTSRSRTIWPPTRLRLRGRILPQ